jgi:hypothetical protein
MMNTTARRSFRPQNPTSKATAGQRGLLATILAERVVPAEAAARLTARIAAGDITVAQFNEYKDWLKKQAKVGAASAAPVAPATTKVTEVGFYLLDGQAYKVIASRSGDFLYARMVTGRGLKKAPGAFAKLTPAMKMTPEQIAAYGVRTSVCVNCSHTLTDPASQGVGLGTDCGPAILGKDVYRAAYKAAKAAAEAAQVAADAAAAVSATPVLDRLRREPFEPLDPEVEAFRRGWEEDQGNLAEAELAAREMAEDAARYGR